MTRRLPRLTVTIVALLVATTAAAREVILPIRPDTGYLEQVFRSQVFIDDGGTARVWDDGAGCGYLVLSDPRIETNDGRIHLISFAEARVGQKLGARCVVVTDWSGTIETAHDVKLASGGRMLRFEVVDSDIRDDSEYRGLSVGVLWDWIKDYVHPRLAAVRIDLQPPLEDLKSVLRLVLQSQRQDVRDSLESIAPKSVSVIDGGVLVELGMQVPDAEQRASPPAQPLSAAELARFEDAWRSWDSFVVFVVKHFALAAAAPEARQELLEVLIEARYDLLYILSADPDVRRDDPVRLLFVDTWRRLAPVLRRMSPELPRERALNLLSFVAAADALRALDDLGPGFDLDISVDGLRRMARLLAPESETDPLEHSEQVDPQLRELFDFGPPLPLRRGRELQPQGWWQGVLPDARAGVSVDEELVERLNEWVPPAGELESYLQSVHRLLDETARDLVADSRLDPALHEMFRVLVLATAWQETCWRQYKSNNGRIVPIRSPAGAVGMMQIVPSVWRGFYDLSGLTNDIAYNASAGGEILLHYLLNYAIRRGEDQQPGGRENLAWATYAAYNGGPGHLGRYRQRNTRKELRRIDSAFRDKYQQIRGGDELAVRECYAG